MVAELNTESQTGNKINDKDGIHLNWISAKDDIEHPHASHKFKED
jgi:hypothetical protein